jgi:pimeloyl-ACP methyl ester carboxylesterase
LTPDRLISRALAVPLAIAGFALSPAVPSSAAERPAPQVKVDVGEISGANFAIANPPGAWSRNVLLIAHGYRPDSAPLIADLHPERASNRALLEEGWIVATTSYRRNGLIVADAMADLDALRAHIAETYGEPDRVILAGESMGGLIVTIMAERDAGPYQGAVVFDATLYAKETDMRVGLSLLPRIPLLFVATQREAREAQSYLTALVARPAPVVQPALFLISREGHTNINQAEHLAAIRALNGWIERGRDALPQPRGGAPYYDATVPPEPGPSTAVPHPDGRGFDTRVAEVDAVYGSVLLEAQAPDFESAGIAPMTFFEFQAGGRSYRTLYGRTYSDAKNDAWVAFPDADGRTVVSRTYASAASTAGLKAGDSVSVAGYGPPAPASR